MNVVTCIDSTDSDLSGNEKLVSLWVNRPFIVDIDVGAAVLDILVFNCFVQVTGASADLYRAHPFLLSKEVVAVVHRLRQDTSLANYPTAHRVITPPTATATECTDSHPVLSSIPLTLQFSLP